MAYTTINKSTDYFNTKLYTGNGSTNAITGVGFQPDWVWIKSRGLARSHQINDAVRGAGKILATDNTGAEFTDTNRITTLDSDGFTLGSNDNVNGSSDNLVSWNWLANGAGSSNTDGSDSSTVSANTTAGFSIVKWTPSGGNATVGHGLGAVPEMIISFRIDGAQDRFVYHKDIGNTKYVRLNQTTASTTDANAWNNTTPTSSVFSVGSQFGGSDYIAYCFAEKKGFSKFGSYTGNGSTDGAFVYTGFKPAFVLIKSVSTTNWNMFDNKRSAFNVADETLWANSSDSESTVGTGYGIDILSNGFKARSTSSQVNFNNTQMIYMAFAEAPLVGSNNVPATAR